MARPPTALTEIFYQFGTEKCYAVLRARGALSWRGTLHRREVIALLDHVIEQDARAALGGPPMLGPSTPDRMGDALLDSPYLGRHGRLMSMRSPRDSDAQPWWHFWRRQ